MADRSKKVKEINQKEIFKNTSGNLFIIFIVYYFIYFSLFIIVLKTSAVDKNIVVRSTLNKISRYEIFLKC